MGRPTKGDEAEAKARRALAERMFASGLTNREIVITLKVTPSTISGWRKRWKREQEERVPKVITPRPYRNGYLW